MRLEYGRHGVEPAVTKRPGSGWRPHVDCSEEYPGCEACRRRPGVDSRLHPIRNRRGSDMSTRALQVCDDPEPLGELDVLDLQCCSLRPAKTTADQHGHHGSISELPRTGRPERANEAIALFCGQPIANTNAEA